MITPSYVRTMAAYNAEMNRRLYTAAARIPDAARRADRGAFWGSIHGTLAHLIWGDANWMARFDGWPRPAVPMVESAGAGIEFNDLAARRAAFDADIEAWAARIDDAWLGADQVWLSSSGQREFRNPRTFLVTHFFNHQTHHRGQAHALITACGEVTDDTDLIFVIDGPR